MEQTAIWSRFIVSGSIFLPAIPWPQTRKSIPAFFTLWIKAILGLSCPSLRLESNVVDDRLGSALMQHYDNLPMIRRDAILGQCIDVPRDPDEARIHVIDFWASLIISNTTR